MEGFGTFLKGLCGLAIIVGLIKPSALRVSFINTRLFKG